MNKKQTKKSTVGITSARPSKRASEALTLQAGGSEILQSNQYKSLALRSMFWRPDYLQGSSAWVEHLPFAFWIIEALQPSLFVELGTHYGHSYFSFCQAIKRLGINTPSYAVDTWKGDDQAGHYDESVYQQVESYNQANYPEFSSLLRCTFDEAVSRFNDGSIDLLHIDGFHTYEAVRHDFESWLPKLSDRAVVLFHDTNVRRDLFGVHKYYAELTGRYPSFEFIHGHGLGVLGVGKDQPELLRSLYTCYAHQPSRNIVYELFSRLGRSCHDLMDLNQERVLIKEIRDLSQKRHEYIVEIEQMTAERGAEIQRLNVELVRLNEEAGAKTSHVARLEQVAGERGAEIERLNGELVSLNEEVGAKTSHVAHLEQVAGERGAEIERLNGELVSLNEEAGAKASQVAHLEQVAGERGAEIEKLNRRVTQLQEECGQKRSQIANLEQDNWFKDSQKDEMQKQFLEEIKCAFQESEKILEICKIQEATTNSFYLDIGSSIRGDENINLTHSHLNFTFENIKLFGRHWKLLQVRLVEHNGKAGLVIFNNVENSSYPLYIWEKDGEENGVDFMIFVPADTKSRIKLVKAPSSDLLLIREITNRIIGYIYVHGDNNLNRWIHVGRKLVQQIDEIDERIHYDDVVVNAIENKDEITINFKITNLYYDGICISSYNISWSLGSKGGYLTLRKPEKEELYNHTISDLGEISNINIEISFESKKEVEKTIYQWGKMTRKEKIFLKLVASEIANLLVHLFCKKTISSKNKIIEQERMINKKISRLNLER